ncbi:MAG: TyeA family type III secretion system gatekeeper subunit [Comamonadaceae bacterium]|nr:MAG: TyeA family type III secretion system gatekeeper subunit [Comamonadaceae bacterium]
MSSPPKPIDTARLVKAMVELLAAGNAPGLHFARLALDMGLPAGAPTINFLSGVKKILRDLPDKAFTEPKARLALVDAVQDALDDAIEAEEEALESGDGQDEEQQAPDIALPPGGTR